MLALIRPLVKCLSAVRRLELGPESASLVIGDWHISCRRAGEPAPTPSLPPRTIVTSGESVEQTAPVQPARLATVHPLRRVA